jgi:hypothetical protein
MKIQYLKILEDNPSAYPHDTDFKLTIRSTPLIEITQLEVLYNNGRLFPTALRELLYLAGDYCYVLDKSDFESQQEMQEYVRSQLELTNKVITNPFMVIDVYNAPSQFLFVYLNAGDNPPVYEASYYATNENWIRPVSNSLSSYIESLIQRVKEGRNPF